MYDFLKLLVSCMLGKTEGSREHWRGRLHFSCRIREAFWVRNKQELAPQRGWRMVFQRRANTKVLEWERALWIEDGEQGWHCLELMRLAGAVLSCIPFSSVPSPERFSPPACVMVRNVFMFVAPISCLLYSFVHRINDNSRLWNSLDLSLHL